MSQKQGSSKKKRTPKKSKEIHGGGGKVSLTTLQKALINPTYLKSLQVQREQNIERERIRR